MDSNIANNNSEDSKSQNDENPIEVNDEDKKEENLDAQDRFSLKEISEKFKHEIVNPIHDEDLFKDHLCQLSDDEDPAYHRFLKINRNLFLYSFKELDPPSVRIYLSDNKGNLFLQFKLLNLHYTVISYYQSGFAYSIFPQLLIHSTEAGYTELSAITLLSRYYEAIKGYTSFFLEIHRLVSNCF